VLVDIQGGRLSGMGSIVGNTRNSGEIYPGFSAGILEMDGDFEQLLPGLLDVEIGGRDIDLFDQLNITGRHYDKDNLVNTSLNYWTFDTNLQ